MVLQEARVSSLTKDNVANKAQDSASESEEEEEEEGGQEEEDQSNSQTSPAPASRAPRPSRDAETESSAVRQRRSGVPEYRASDNRASWQKSHQATSRESASKENNRNSANNLSSSTSKSPNKISNILRSFEQKEEDGAKPKTRVDSSVDISARKKSFEKIGARSSVGDSSRSWSTDREAPRPRSAVRSEVMSQSSSSSVYASTKNAGKVN